MDLKLYSDIVSLIRNYRGLSKDCYVFLTESFPNVDSNRLSSILSLEYQKRMKCNHIKTQSTKNKYFDLYIEALRRGEEPGVILKLSVQFDVAPCLVAKLILQKYFESLDTTDSDDHLNLNRYLRDTTLIPDMDLAYEIYLCTLYDFQYSPVVEMMRHSIGQQYEIQLCKQIRELGLAFKDENHLRKFGYDKTPDFKLDVPIAIDGFVINWIESKALFGDEDNHKEYMKNQYSSYWNRFGPGLVIYWFGFIESVIQPSDKRFIIRDHLPTTNIIHIVPPTLPVDLKTESVS